MARWTHKYIAETGSQRNAQIRADAKYAEDPSDSNLEDDKDGHLSNWRREKWLKEWMERLKTQRVLTATFGVRDAILRICNHIRGLGEEIQNKYGREALDLLHDRMDEAVAAVFRGFPKSEDLTDEQVEELGRFYETCERADEKALQHTTRPPGLEGDAGTGSPG